MAENEPKRAQNPPKRLSTGNVPRGSKSFKCVHKTAKSLIS
jgi:hypothetical protein